MTCHWAVLHDAMLHDAEEFDVMLQCKDAQWPANKGGSCKSGLKCARVSEFHWGCDLKEPAP